MAPGASVPALVAAPRTLREEARVRPVVRTRLETTNALAMLAATACVVVMALVLYGAPVPRLSEELYLPLARHTGNPSFLSGDWTLRGPFNEHWVFDHAFGWLASAVPLTLFGWVGRIVAWTVLAALLLRLGRRLGASIPATVAALGLWLFANQSFVGGEWMFGTFEAKTVGYCFLVGALVAAAERRVLLAFVLVGATVSFHPGVGIWAGFGLGLTLVALHETRATALRSSVVGVVIAIPGIVGAVSASHFRSAGLVRFIVLEAIPQHADPFFGGARLAGLQIGVRAGALVGMFLANWWWMRRAPAGFPHALMFGVQAVTMAACVAGVVARITHWWSFLLLAPFRVGPLIVVLMFFLNVTRRVDEQRRLDRGHPWWARRSVRLAALGIASAVFVTSPLLAGPRMIDRTYLAWTTPDPVGDALSWIRDHTPKATRCVVPIDRQDALMRSERPIVVNWQAIRYDDVAEWQRRVFQLVGGPRYFLDPSAPGRIAGRRGGDLESLRGAYDALSQRRIVAAARRYHASCIVSTTRYRLPISHRTGDARVYAVPDDQAEPPNP